MTRVDGARLAVPSGKITESVLWPLGEAQGRLPGREFALTARTSGGHGLQQSANADDRYYPLHVIGEHIERHLGRHLTKPPHQEVRCAHPALARTEGVLHRLPADGHCSGI